MNELSSTSNNGSHQPLPKLMLLRQLNDKSGHLGMLSTPFPPQVPEINYTAASTSLVRFFKS